MVFSLPLVLQFGNFLPFGDASSGMRRYNPIPYSPILTRFDQDGDGDFDLKDIKLILSKKENNDDCCIALTKNGKRCKRNTKLDENKLCYTHRNYQKTN